jgi:hypothetical protein
VQAGQSFERRLVANCESRVGSGFAIDSSRLMRNGGDWHTLIEFRGLVGPFTIHAPK